MLTLLIISKNNEFLQKCRSSFRKIGYRNICADNMLEGLKEVKWSFPDLIIWNTETITTSDKKVLSILKHQYSTLPLLFVINNDELVNQLGNVSEELIFRNNDIEKLTIKVVELIGEPQPTGKYAEDNFETDMSLSDF